ncbi:hypothetical protein ccbrp13_18990 [Ktedonobacteria bacterium brp13]|nr:hypothetical protein ccbrp13_18990 [Ktedonobacteria bacterium brp13]
MYYYIDIDGTIAYRNMIRFATVCNDKLQLHIASDRLRCRYVEFLQFPEVRAYVQRVGDEVAHNTIGWLDYDSQVLLAMHPYSDAVAGVATLASHGEIAYATARHGYTDEMHQEIMHATTRWLEKKAFLPGSKTLFCTGIADKLSRIAQCVHEVRSFAVLIDDQYDRLQASLACLDPEKQRILRDRVILVAFGCEVLPHYDEPAFPMVGMASWSQAHVHDMLNHVERLMVSI